jgi:glycosyltransferase involved in cell wall biosynthesis
MAEGRVTIGYLNPLAKIGGAERSLLDVIGALDPARYRAVLFLPAAGPLVAAAERRGAKVHVTPLPGMVLAAGRHAPWLSLAVALLAPLLILPTLIKMIVLARREKVSLLHANGIKVHLLTCLMKRVLRVPVVWHLRDFSAGRRMWPLYCRLAAWTADALIANSQAVAREWEGCHPNVQVAYNGIDLAHFAPPEGDPRPRKGYRVAMLGVLTPWKGHGVFLDALRLLVDKGSDVQAWIIGDAIYDTGGHAGYRGRLERQVAALGLVGRVEFLGFRDDVPTLLHQTEVVVHASVSPEPFGRVVAEALAAGCAVVAADDGGVPEIVTHERHALLTPPGDATALAEALWRLELDPELRRTLAEAGRKRVTEKFALADNAPRTTAIYETLLKDR